jgi:cell division protein FtsN
MIVRRMTRTFPLLAALLLGAACAVLVACGGSGSSDDLIPDQQAATMVDQLDKIQSSVSRGRCSGVDNQVVDLQAQINDLSNKVDAGLRARLQEGVNNLADIAPDECFARRDRQQTTTTTETTPTQTQTVETTTTETTTTETTPTTPETVPTTPETVPTTPQTTETTPPGGATIPGDAGTGDTGGATPVTP